MKTLIVPHVLLFLTCACGGVSDSQDGREREEQVNRDELIALAGVSAQDSQKAYGHCSEILSQGIYNRYKNDMSDMSKYALQRRFCSMDAGQFSEQVYKYYQNKSSAERLGAHEGQFELSYMETLGLGASGSSTTTSSSTSELTKEEAEAIAKSWRKEHCASEDEYSSQDYVHQVLSESVDENIVQAWRDCVTENHHGLFCESRIEGNTISTLLKWVPNAVQQKVLPRLNLELLASVNAKIQSTRVPEELGPGSGVSLTFLKEDAESSSVIEYLAQDPGKNVSFSCSLQVPKYRGELKRDAKCGVEQYVTSQAEVCGVEAFRESRGENCGVESFQEKRSEVCGVEKYKKSYGRVCGDSSGTYTIKLKHRYPANVNGTVTIRQAFNLKYECDIADDKPETYSVEATEVLPPSSSTVVGFQGTTPLMEGEFKVTCSYKRWKSCRHPTFGVDTYNLCRDESHGVEKYKLCRDASFGVEKYKPCEHPSFGVALNKQCLVK